MNEINKTAPLLLSVLTQSVCILRAVQEVDGAGNQIHFDDAVLSEPDITAPCGGSDFWSLL